MQNPRDVWADVYDRQVDELTRILINLTVLNGGFISERDLASAFRDCALRDKIATPSNVSDIFERTMRGAVGSTLTRKLNARFGTVTIEPFNPSISDFVLPKLVDDHQTLSAFLQTLKTPRSIDNISSLLTSGKISRNNYTLLVRDLCDKSLNLKVGSQYPNYFWRLAHLAFTEITGLKALTADDYIAELNSMVNPDFCSGGSMEIACVVISELIKMGRDKTPANILDFLSWAISESESADEFEKTGILISTLESAGVEGVEELKDRHRAAALEYWMEDVSHLINEGNVLVDFLSDEQYTDAQNWAREYIDRTCGYLALSDDEVDEIMDGIDFSQVQYDNQKAAYEFYSETERPMPGLTAEAVISPQDGVDDLFDRS